jgi:hypothetical protein
VTLVLTCLMPDYVVQVADSRLTRVVDGQIDIVDEHAWKAVVVESSMVVGYSGLANLAADLSEPTDIWLLEQPGLLLPEGLRAAKSLASTAKKRFARISPRIAMESRRHAFALAGWETAGRGEPFVAVVSNAVGPKNEWASRPASHFDVHVDYLGSRELFLRPIGAAMGPTFRHVEDEVRGELRNAGRIDRIVAALCRGVRAVASQNRGVGDELLITVLPKASAGEPGRGLELSLELTGNAVRPDAPSFLFSDGTSGHELVARYPYYVYRSGLRLARMQILPRAPSEAEMREIRLHHMKGFERDKFRQPE